MLGTSIIVRNAGGAKAVLATADSAFGQQPCALPMYVFVLLPEMKSSGNLHLGDCLPCR